MGGALARCDTQPDGAEFSSGENAPIRSRLRAMGIVAGFLQNRRRRTPNHRAPACNHQGAFQPISVARPPLHKPPPSGNDASSNGFLSFALQTTSDHQPAATCVVTSHGGARLAAVGTSSHQSVRASWLTWLVRPDPCHPRDPLAYMASRLPCLHEPLVTFVALRVPDVLPRWSWCLDAQRANIQ